jgi:hypothetical protein
MTWTLVTSRCSSTGFEARGWVAQRVNETVMQVMKRTHLDAKIGRIIFPLNGGRDHGITKGNTGAGCPLKTVCYHPTSGKEDRYVYDYL